MAKEAKNPKVKISPREINLVKALQDAEAADRRLAKKGKVGAKLYVAAGLLVVVVVGVYAALFMYRKDLTEQRDTQLLTWNDPEYISMVQLSEELAYESDYMKRLESSTMQQIAPLEDQFRRYEFYTADLYKVIRAEFDGKINIRAISAKEEILTLELIAQTPADAAKFVSRLRSTGAFYNIEYSGFTEADDDSSAEFSITCHLTEPAGEEGGES